MLADPFHRREHVAFLHRAERRHLPAAFAVRAKIEREDVESPGTSRRPG
jgi:hypothetical protein